MKNISTDETRFATFSSMKFIKKSVFPLRGDVYVHMNAVKDLFYSALIYTVDKVTTKSFDFYLKTFLYPSSRLDVPPSNRFISLRVV